MVEVEGLLVLQATPLKRVKTWVQAPIEMPHDWEEQSTVTKN